MHQSGPPCLYRSFPTAGKGQGGQWRGTSSQIGGTTLAMLFVPMFPASSSSPFPLFFSGIYASFHFSPMKDSTSPIAHLDPSAAEQASPPPSDLEASRSLGHTRSFLATHNDDGSGALGLRIIGGALALRFLCAWDSVLQSVTASPRDVVSSRDSKYTRDNDAGGCAHPDMRRGLDGRRRWRIWSGNARVVSAWEYDGG
ncbi:hypothetical protein IQ07DRAFT_594693 [Pyrenochaeta sp. DS3sAY3a]|nr:hypothetical protein IQ07DRAFT_594693 [Pyrenochaeta sp. DS3sAY3a]